MKVVIQATPEQLDLLRKTGDRNRSQAFPAMEAFAAVLAPVVQVVLDKMSTVRGIYSVKNLGEFDVAEFPLDVYFNEQDGEIMIHLQNRPGGTPSSFLSDIQTVVVQTAPYMAEVSWQNKFARSARMDVIAQYVHRLAQVMLRKEELNGWAVLLKAVATSAGHVVGSTTTDGVFHLDLLNQLLTKAKRLNTSIDGGTAVAAPQGITDVYLSVEAMGDVRSFSYNPVNVRGATGAAVGGDVVTLPEDTRRSIIAGGGIPSLLGLTLHEMNELGCGQSYNKLMKSFYSGSFTEATQECVIGLDNSRDSNVMPVVGGLVVQNDVFTQRGDRSGVIASQNMGFAVLDTRAIVAGIVK